MAAVRVEYVGFVNTGLAREYSLVVQEGAGESKTFVLVIPNDAFTSRFARYQDGPDICSTMPPSRGARRRDCRLAAARRLLRPLARVDAVDLPRRSRSPGLGGI